MVAHHAFGGSIALAVPSRAVSVVVLVNELSLDRAAAKCVLELVCDQLDLGDPASLVHAGMF